MTIALFFVMIANVFSLLLLIRFYQQQLEYHNLASALGLFSVEGKENKEP